MNYNLIAVEPRNVIALGKAIVEVYETREDSYAIDRARENNYLPLKYDCDVSFLTYFLIPETMDIAKIIESWNTKKSELISYCLLKHNQPMHKHVELVYQNLLGKIAMYHYSVPENKVWAIAATMHKHLKCYGVDLHKEFIQEQFLSELDMGRVYISSTLPMKAFAHYGVNIAECDSSSFTFNPVALHSQFKC